LSNFAQIYKDLDILYNTGIRLYYFAAGVASLFSHKASLFYKGRRGLLRHISNRMQVYSESEGRRYWFHCASAGEFEQARPLVDRLKEREPESIVIVTFFSPSGYELRKNYPKADEVFYLPMDTPRKAERFIDMVLPDVVYFVKYEFWKNYLALLKNRGIPLYLVSAIFREDQRFFGRGGAAYARVLGCFTHMYVQDKNSARLLASLGFDNVTVAGDTRFDRVWEVMQKNEKVTLLELYRRASPEDSLFVVCGSTWPADEDVLLSFLSGVTAPASGKEACVPVRMVIAPHEISDARVKDICRKFSSFNTVLYTDLLEMDEAQAVSLLGNCDVLVANVMGVLSRLYSYADIAYIGGGFGVGIHNTLEAAVYGVPVVFGPSYGKFREAVELVECGGAFPVDREGTALSELAYDSAMREKSALVCREYVQENRGATSVILESNSL
jgi:3-deoxy-D-manno-octulosonic-acid transferase